MTDTMREKFERWAINYAHKYNLLRQDVQTDATWASYNEAWQAAQADARALVGELVANLAVHNPHNPALTKAQAFMEGK